MYVLLEGMSKSMEVHSNLSSLKSDHDTLLKLYAKQSIIIENMRKKIEAIEKEKHKTNDEIRKLVKKVEGLKRSEKKINSAFQEMEQNNLRLKTKSKVLSLTLEESRMQHHKKETDLKKKLADESKKNKKLVKKYTVQKSQLESLNDNPIGNCSVCCNEPANYIFVPCGHLSVGYQCVKSGKFKKCIICRQKATLIKVFLHTSQLK